MTENNKSKTNRSVGLLLILLSVVLLWFSVSFFRKYCGFFQTMFTFSYSGYFLTFDVASVNQVLLAHLRHILILYFKGYILPVFLLLLPAIFCLSAGIFKLTGREIKAFTFMENEKKERAFIITVLSFSFIFIILTHFLVLQNFAFST